MAEPKQPVEQDPCHRANHDNDRSYPSHFLIVFEAAKPIRAIHPLVQAYTAAARQCLGLARWLLAFALNASRSRVEKEPRPSQPVFYYFFSSSLFVFFFLLSFSQAFLFSTPPTRLLSSVGGAKAQSGHLWSRLAQIDLQSPQYLPGYLTLYLPGDSARLG